MEARIVIVIALFLYPGTAVTSFESTNPHTRRVDSDHNALWFFILAIVSGISIGTENYLFSTASARLCSKLRSKAFRAVLRQDS